MSDRRIPLHILNAVTAADETLREGERLIFERINGQVMARIETADVPVLGTTPVGPSPVQLSRSVFERDANPDGTIDVLAHLSPADRESARRLTDEELAKAEREHMEARLRRLRELGLYKPPN